MENEKQEEKLARVDEVEEGTKISQEASDAENVNAPIITEDVVEEKVLSRKEKRRIRKQKWKEVKKNKKLERKAKRKEKRENIRKEYEYAPFLVRFFHVHKAGIIGTLVSLFTVFILWSIIDEVLLDGMGIDGIKLLIDYTRAMDSDVRFMDYDMEEVYAITPYDEEGAQRVKSLPVNKADDSWTFCVYMVGADLESFDENDLSLYVKYITRDVYNENTLKDKSDRAERIKRYADELDKNNLDMPNYMYEINKPIASSIAVTQDVIVADGDGAASTDISEIVSTELPDNVTIVLQTGGSARWSHAMVNPNRTQRFVFHEGVLDEVANMHIQDSCDPATLTDYIKFCNDNYKSDHMALILWDHGAGAFGYGVDEIFNSGFSLAEVREALMNAVEPNATNPYYDFIGFDACLMATVETAKTIDGFAQYLVASEETEPGDGWDYYSWLEGFSDNPAMNGAQIGQVIADTYMDFYTKQAISFPNYAKSAVTFSVIDIPKAVEAYNAYEKLNDKLLTYVAEDEAVMTEISRAASKTIRYAGSAYSIYNQIDLGMYLDYLSEIYPEECEETKKLVKEAVLYKRSNYNLEGSQGLAVYFPVTIEDIWGVDYCLDYIYNISNQESTKALYYYKIAGCLNEDLSKYVEGVAGKAPSNLNTQMFYDYKKIVPEITDDQKMSITISKELMESIQDVSLLEARYDEAANRITYYGQGNSCTIDSDGNLVGNIMGTGFVFGGSLLEANLSYTTDTTSTYIAKILHNGKPSYLTFTDSKENDQIIINSVVPIPQETDRIYDAALRVTNNLNPGDTIVPLLTVDNPDTGESIDMEGMSFTYKENKKVERDNLPNGTYLTAIIITDIRGDEYYSPVVECQIKNGKVSDLRINPDFIGD